MLKFICNFILWQKLQQIVILKIVFFSFSPPKINLIDENLKVRSDILYDMMNNDLIVFYRRFHDFKQSFYSHIVVISRVKGVVIRSCTRAQNFFAVNKYVSTPNVLLSLHAKTSHFHLVYRVTFDLSKSKSVQ